MLEDNSINSKLEWFKEIQEWNCKYKVDETNALKDYTVEEVELKKDDVNYEDYDDCKISWKA